MNVEREEKNVTICLREYKLLLFKLLGLWTNGTLHRMLQLLEGSAKKNIIMLFSRLMWCSGSSIPLREIKYSCPPHPLCCRGRTL